MLEKNDVYTNQTQKSETFFLESHWFGNLVMRCRTLECISKRSHLFLKVWTQEAQGILSKSLHRQTDGPHRIHLMSSHIRMFVSMKIQETVKFLFCFCSWSVLITACPQVSTWRILPLTVKTICSTNFVFLCLVLETEPRSSHILDKRLLLLDYKSEPQSQLWTILTSVIASYSKEMIP